MELLAVRGVTKRFGGILAVNDVSFTLNKGETLGIIGPNGSGKSTLLDCVVGRLKADKGTVIFNGKDISSYKPDQVAKLGIGKTDQRINLFPNLTVYETLLLGLQEYRKHFFLQGHFEDEKKKAEEMLKFIGMVEAKDQLMTNLAFGEQKLLDLGAVLISEPKVVFLDEPAGGLNLNEVQKLKKYIVEVHNQGGTFIIVEHNVKFIMDLCQRILVLHMGEKLMEGTPEQVRKDPGVIEIYLGT